MLLLAAGCWLLAAAAAAAVVVSIRGGGHVEGVLVGHGWGGKEGLGSSAVCDQSIAPVSSASSPPPSHWSRAFCRRPVVGFSSDVGAGFEPGMWLGWGFIAACRCAVVDVV